MVIQTVVTIWVVVALTGFPRTSGTDVSLSGSLNFKSLPLDPGYDVFFPIISHFVLLAFMLTAIFIYLYFVGKYETYCVCHVTHPTNGKLPYLLRFACLVVEDFFEKTILDQKTFSGCPEKKQCVDLDRALVILWTKTGSGPKTLWADCERFLYLVYQVHFTLVYIHVGWITLLELVIMCHHRLVYN